MPELTVSVHQPNFMPWLKLLDKILASDVYVAYDTAQYTKSEYHSRQKIKTHSGEAWLTVPTVSTGSRRGIADVEIDNTQPWRKKHLKTLRTNYAKAGYFDEVYALVADIYAKDHTHLADLSLDLITAFCSYLDSEVRIVRASSLPHEGDKVDRLIQLVRHAGGNVHLTSTYGGDHQQVDWDRMQAAGIAIRSQVFQHPTYNQLWEGFSPNLAAIDMLFTCGPNAGKTLETNRRLDDIDAPAAQQPRAETAS